MSEFAGIEKWKQIQSRDEFIFIFVILRLQMKLGPKQRSALIIDAHKVWGSAV